MGDPVTNDPVRQRTLNEEIIAYLSEPGRSFNRLEAFHLFGTMNAHSRMSEIQREGYPVMKRHEEVETQRGPVKLVRYSFDHHPEAA